MKTIRYDVIIIGGGINGLGIARELQLRGVNTCVVEKGDIGSGTSAASTRLIHGGLRYLANLKDIPAAFVRHPSLFTVLHGLNSSARLVKESLFERAYLLRNAPHLVRPIQLVIPTQKTSGFEKSRGEYRGKKLAEPVHQNHEVRAGLLFYDACSKSVGDQLALSKAYSSTQFKEEYRFGMPGSTGGLSYYDAQVVFPERLCVENAVDAVAKGMALRTHTEAKALLVDVKPDASRQGESPSKRMRGIEVEDLLTRETSILLAPIVINATGSWVDLLNTLPQKVETRQGAFLEISDRKQFGRMIGGTKGTHIIVRRFAGAPGDYGIYAQAGMDGRPYFILPWQSSPGGDKENDLYLIGTTDTEYKGDLDRVLPTREEVSYLLDETNRLLSYRDGARPISMEDVLYAYAGVRPLPDESGKSAGQKTREHIIADHALEKPYPGYGLPSEPERIEGLLSIIGGKLTTYRSLGEEAVRYLASHYKTALARPNGKRIRLNPKSLTKHGRHGALPGAGEICGDPSKASPWKQFETYKTEQAEILLAKHGVSQATANHLLDLYGSRHAEVVNLRSKYWPADALKRPLARGSANIGAQVAYSIEREFARTLPDVMRRIGANWHADLGMAEAMKAAEIAAPYFGWDKARTEAETERYARDAKERYLSWKSNLA